MEAAGNRVMRLLLISFYFPPAGGGGVQRSLKLAAHLSELGFETHVVAPDDPRWIHRDEELQARIPRQVIVHRAHYAGPRGRRPAEELYGRTGFDRLVRRMLLMPRRFVLPDENSPWALTAVPRATGVVRRHGIDVVVTTSPPGSVHVIGAAVQRATGVRWVADLRDPIVGKEDRRIGASAVRLKEQTNVLVARLVAAHADAVVAVTDEIASEMRALNPSLLVETIPNGADFDEFDNLRYRPGDRFRITHAGSFFGRRDPRPFLRALGRAPDVVARFVGDFRATDRAWAEELCLGDRLQLLPFQTRGRVLELERDTEALLLLLPELGLRGLGIPSGKLFEYLAARRPILAAVPTEGAAAGLVRQAGAGIVVPPDDADAIAEALDSLVARWRADTLDLPPLDDAFRARIDRRARNEEFATLLRQIT